MPEDSRKKEELLKQAESQKPAEPAADLKFSIPKEEDEDIEIIEIDEGEIEQVLANEPLIARMVYRATAFVEEVKLKLFASKEIEPAPKLPPQFFSPPPIQAKSTGSASALSKTMPGIPGAKAPGIPGAPLVAGAPMAPLSNAASKARLMPMASAPHRVRVIKRIRKPVRVSFVTSDDVKLMHVDISKRRFTFAALAGMFLLLMGGGWYLLHGQRVQAQDSKRQADAQLADVKQQILDRQKTWKAFQDLEPRLKALSGLLGTHVSPSNLLESIESRTLPTVSYSSFSVTADGRLQLAVTADSLATAARQVVAFKTSDFIKTIDAGNYTVTYDPKSDIPKAVQFQLNLLLTPDTLRTSIKPAAASSTSL